MDRASLLACIEAQRCPWCGRERLRSLASHIVRVHGIYAAEIRELAGLRPDAPLCSSTLSESHRNLARAQNTTLRLRRPEVLRKAAATREANYGDEERRRRIDQLDAIRPMAVQVARAQA